MATSYPMSSAAATALAYIQAGISVVPIRSDGSKAAMCAWKRFQSVLATASEVRELFPAGCGIAAVTGKISGFLEVIDCEAEAPFHEWLSLVESTNPSLAASLVIVNTPSGGHHVLYRCPAGIQGNQKLAMRLVEGVAQVLIETRGEGGYILTVGCPAGCHPAGKLYTLLQGDLIPGNGEHSIPVITADDRELLLDAARSFDEAQKQASVARSGHPAGDGRPGDRYASETAWPSILRPHGWIQAGHAGIETLWRRPGKKFGFSATTNFKGSDLFYVFSTNAAPFAHETSYSKFAAFAILEHGGDFKAAARVLADRYRPQTTESVAQFLAESASETENFVVPAHWKRLDVALVQDWKCEPLRPIVDNIFARGNFVFVAAQSQTGKTLWALNLARKILQGGQLFGKYAISPVERVLYLLLEDPDRRAQDRILDTAHEFIPLEAERFIIHVAPSFTLTDGRMMEWLEQIIATEKRDVVFIDTYQKSTPGLASFDDEKQGIILHKLANLSRRMLTTMIVLDHFRKTPNSGNGKHRSEVTIDDLKGTGGKAQNADCIILMERTPDRKQIKFQAFSKDFDNPVRILLDVAPRGSQDAKFTYAADMDQMGRSASGAARDRQESVLDSMPDGEWVSVAVLATNLGLNHRTIKRYLTILEKDAKVESEGVKKAMRYRKLIGQF